MTLYLLLLQKLKRFCCSSCPYRSNFRSDVVRHIRHKHPTVECAAGVSKLDPASAAASLADYMNTWARKKFVLNSRRRRGHRRSPPAQQGTSTADKQLNPSALRSSTAVQRVMPPPGISRVHFAAPEVIGSISPKACGSEDGLVIDTGSEDNDDKCGAGEREQQTQSSLLSSNWSNINEPDSRCPLSLSTHQSLSHGDCQEVYHPVTDLNTADKDRDVRQMCNYLDSWGSGISHPASSAFLHQSDVRFSSTASDCLVTVQGPTCSSVIMNSLNTNKQDHPQSVAVTDDASRSDVDKTNEFNDDVDSGQQWSSTATRVKKRLIDVEERRPAEQRTSLVHVDCQPQLQRPVIKSVPETSRPASVPHCRLVRGGDDRRRCWSVLSTNDDDDYENDIVSPGRNMVDSHHLPRQSQP